MIFIKPENRKIRAFFSLEPENFRAVQVEKIRFFRAVTPVLAGYQYPVEPENRLAIPNFFAKSASIKNYIFRHTRNYRNIYLPWIVWMYSPNGRPFNDCSMVVSKSSGCIPPKTGFSFNAVF